MTDFNIKENLVKLSEEDRVKFRNDEKFDILQYWELRRFSHPELYKLSQDVLSIPATQVSVPGNGKFTIAKFPGISR